MTNISKNSNDILVIQNLTKIYHTKDGETLAIKDLNLNMSCLVEILQLSLILR